jgi:hypothetical protein
MEASANPEDCPMMELLFDADDLRPLVRLVVAEALDRLERDRAKFDGRLAFSEAEAAALLGVKPYVLRDCRRRGELERSKIGSKIMYTRADLLEFLERQKQPR